MSTVAFCIVNESGSHTEITSDKSENVEDALASILALVAGFEKETGEEASEVIMWAVDSVRSDLDVKRELESLVVRAAPSHMDVRVRICA